MTEPWTRAHDIAVKVTGLDPRTDTYLVEEKWAPIYRDKWLCALRAAQMAIGDLPVVAKTDLVVGVVTSEDGRGEKTQISVKQWSVGVEGPPRITFGINLGDERWVETEVKPEDALKVVTLILNKKVIREMLA